MTFFNKYDKYLMNFISSYYKKNFEKIQKESLMYKFDINKEAFDKQKVFATDKKGKKYVFKFFTIGVLQDGFFTWNGTGINQSLYASLIKTNISIFKKETFNKLFNNNRIELSKEHLKIIPYILSIMLTDYNVIEAVSPDKKTSLFFLTDTKLTDKFDYDGLLNLLNMIDEMNDMSKKGILKRTSRKRKTSRKKKN